MRGLNGSGWGLHSQGEWVGNERMFKIAEKVFTL